MANICDSCGKGNMVGRRVTFSGKRNRRVFRANIHSLWIGEVGRKVRAKLCTKCLKATRKSLAPAVTAPVVA
jgi:large subunit ribosomal protein L28